MSAVRRLSFRSLALIYQTRVEKHAASSVEIVPCQSACDLWNVLISLVLQHERLDVDKCGGGKKKESLFISIDDAPVLVHGYTPLTLWSVRHAACNTANGQLIIACAAVEFSGLCVQYL